MMKIELKQISRMTGFTLLEVLIVLSLIVVLSTVAVPNMGRLIADSRQASAANELLIAMNIARSEALKRHRHVTVCKSADGESCGSAGVGWRDGWIVFANSSSANVSQRDAGEELLHVAPAIGGKAVIEPAAAVQNFISIRPTGRSSSAALFTVCDDHSTHEARGVIILPSGHARVSDKAPGGEDLTCSTGG